MPTEADHPATGRHIPALDGIRALAILLVIPHNVDVLSTSFPAIDYPAAALMHAGWIGVQLFFVLSGFLITGNLLDSRGSPHYFSAFFGRRALRILPLYFAVLCAAFVIAPLLLRLPEELRASSPHQLWLWTFLCNWTEPYGGGVYGFGHFWSLAVEEQFYLLWPLLVLRCRPPVLLWVCLGIALLSFVIRAVLMAADFPHEALYMFTICRMDALALGAAAAAAVRIPTLRGRLAAMTTRLALVATVLFLGTALGTRGFAVYEISTQSIGYTLLSLAFALTLLLTALPTTGLLNAAMRILGGAVLRPIGRYSYGMYVFHLPLHVFVGSPLLHRFAAEVSPGTALAYTAGMTVATFVLAAISYELFERRFLRLKTRFATSAAPDSARAA
jgi:peptidoglycan/LPS O-acetylase OafA/YrhL